MAEAGVHGSWIDEVGEAELFDAALPLEVGVVDGGQQLGFFDGKEAIVDGVVDDFAGHRVGECLLQHVGQQTCGFGHHSAAGFLAHSQQARAG